MNIIDFILALIFFCAIGYYALKLHKKRVKARAENAGKGTPDTAQNGIADSDIARLLSQVPQNNPHIMGTLADNPALTGIGKTGIKLCKLIPIKLDGIPDGLPFGDTYDSSDFNKSLMTAGYEVNEELKALNDTGFTVFAATPMLLCSDMLILCITAGKISAPATQQQ